LVTLLSSRIPDLQHHNFAINGYFFVAKVSSDGWLEVAGEPRMLKHLNK